MPRPSQAASEWGGFGHTLPFYHPSNLPPELSEPLLSGVGNLHHLHLMPSVLASWGLTQPLHKAAQPGQGALLVKDLAT